MVDRRRSWLLVSCSVVVFLTLNALESQICKFNLVLKFEVFVIRAKVVALYALCHEVIMNDKYKLTNVFSHTFNYPD